MDMQPQQIEYQPIISEEKFATELLNDMAVKSGCENEAMYYSDYLVEAHNTCETDIKTKQRFKPVKARNKMSVKRIGGSDCNIPGDMKTGYSRPQVHQYDDYNYLSGENPYISQAGYSNQENTTSNNQLSESVNGRPTSNTSVRTVNKKSARSLGRKSISQHTRQPESYKSDQQSNYQSDHQTNQDNPIPKIGKRWCMKIDENGCMAGMYARKSGSKNSPKMNKGDNSDYQLNSNKTIRNVSFHSRRNTAGLPDIGNRSFESLLNVPGVSSRKSQQKQRWDDIEDCACQQGDVDHQNSRNDEKLKSMQIPDLSVFVPSLMHQLFGVMSGGEGSKTNCGVDVGAMAPAFIRMFTNMMQKQSDPEKQSKPNPMMCAVAEMIADFLKRKVGYKVDPDLIHDLIQSDAVKQGLTKMARRMSQSNSLKAADEFDSSSCSSTCSAVVTCKEDEDLLPPLTVPSRAYKPLNQFRTSAQRPLKSDSRTVCPPRTPSPCERLQSRKKVPADHRCGKAIKVPAEMVEFARRFLEHVEEQADQDEGSESEECAEDRYGAQRYYETWDGSLDLGRSGETPMLENFFEDSEWKAQPDSYRKEKSQYKQYQRETPIPTPRNNMGRVYRDDEMSDFMPIDEAVPKYSAFNRTELYNTDRRFSAYNDELSYDSRTSRSSRRLTPERYPSTDSMPYRTVGGRSSDRSISDYSPFKSMLQNLMTTFLQPRSPQYT